jgi:hypothetical protein
MPSRDSFITGPSRAEIRAAEAKAKAAEKAKKAKAAKASAARIAKLQQKKDELVQRLTLRSSARPRGTYSGGCGNSGGCR